MEGHAKITSDQYRFQLEREGWRTLGSGHFAVVLGHPDHDYVIKVGRRDMDKDGYPAYAAFCLERQDNPHVPRIHSFEWFDCPEGSVNKRFYVVRMEKLECTTAQYRECRTHDSPFSRAEVHAEARSVLYYTGTASCLPEYYPALYSLMLDIARGLRRVYSVDLHEYNTMWRRNDDGTYTFVVTDPLSFSDPVRGIATSEAAA